MSMRCVDWGKKKKEKRKKRAIEKTERIADEHALCGLGKKERKKKRANEKNRAQCA